MIRYQVCLLYLTVSGGLLLGQSYSGALQGANCGIINGWATGGTEGVSQLVDIYDGHNYLMSVGAYAYPSYFWQVNTPASLLDNQVHLIYAYYGGTSTILSGSPVTLQCTNGATGYQYYYTDTFSTINTSNWTQNGSVYLSSGIGLEVAGTTAAGVIGKTGSSTDPGSANYEIKSTLRIQSNGGVYAQYLRASSTAPSTGSSYVSVEIQNPQFSTTSGQCSATLAVYQSVSGTVTSFLSTPIACHDYMQIRSEVTGSYANVLVNGVVYEIAGITIASGMPGVGGSAMPYAGNNNGIFEVQLGPHDGVAPGSVNTYTVTTDVYPNNVTAQWQGAVDDSNGSGIGWYYITRSGGTGSYTAWNYDASFYDGTVQPSTLYTYTIQAWDFHGNGGQPVTFPVTTPPTGAVPPQRIGVRPTGSYWGGAGEQIDLLSGNLNYSLPLVTAVARGGLKATFALSYNSQNWVEVAGQERLLGADTGYGFGWQLMLGSLLPVWEPGNVIAYYLFTDSAGAQYRLNQQNGTVWSSSESTYVWYDSYANRLHFRNGSFWVMGSTSAGGEQDAGTLYPTVVEDSNGNQILISYNAGIGVDWNNSSSRINTIEDVRAQSCSYSASGYCSYAFAYASSPSGLPYLSTITSYTGTVENYSFTINQGQPLYAPNGVSFNTAGELASVTATPTSPLGYSWNFTYELPTGSTGPLGDGSLTEVQLPQGGHLRWAYTTFQYKVNRVLEEVANRYLLSTLGGSENTYPFTRPSADTPGSIFVHSGMTLTDSDGTQKTWLFNTGSGFNIGLVSELEDPFENVVYTWAQDSVGDAYLGTVQTTISVGMSWAQTTTTTQTQDSYGNVLTSAISDYQNLSTRTYTNTYLYTQPNYSQYYLYDRLLTSTVSNGSTNITLVSNTYDNYHFNLTPPHGTPREQDWGTYGSTFYYRGNVTRSVTPGRTINSYYDTTGAVISKDDNNGHSVAVTTSTATNFTLPDKLDPNGTGALVNQASYNAVSLAPASSASPMQSLYDPNTAPNGTAAYTHYDGYGRVDYTLAPSQVANQAAGARTNYTYTYTSGQWTVTATTQGTSASHWTTKTLDGLGRVIKVQSGYGTTVVSEVDTIYAPFSCAPLGKVYQKSEPYPGTGTVSYTTYGYDSIGLTTSVTLADGSVTKYIYYANVTDVVDPKQHWKQYFSDAFGNLVTVIEPDPAYNPARPQPPPTYPVTNSNLPAEMLLTSYSYDLLNHLTGVSMPRMVSGTLQTQTRTFNYDPTTQRLTSAVNPENGTIAYTYNSDGTQATKVFNNGNKETYEYDTYQRLTKIHRFPGGINEDTTQLQTYVYDTNGAGMLASATFASGVGSANQLTLQNQYTYTPAGKVSSKTLYLQSANHANAPGSLTVSYGYDNQGAVTSMTYPAGYPTYTYALDAMERPTGLTDSNNYTWVSGVTYNSNSQMTAATFPAGAQAWVYNSLFQLTQYTSGTAVNMTYNYFPAGKNTGQIISSVDAINGETITYTYDALKRLSAASSTAGWSDTYTYDGFGNLTGMTPTGGAPTLSVTSDWTTNRITPTGVSYDGNGNITAMPGSLSLGYDVANRMTSVNSTSAYAYDPTNLRAYYRNTSGTETVYLYGVSGNKLATYKITGISNNTIQFLGQSQNVYFANKLISAEGSAVAVDHLGSVRSNAGAGHTYYPFGVEYSATTNDTEKYGTYTRDSLTGLDYAMNRYYSSIWGRFTSADPSWASVDLRSPLSWNRYFYCLGDPVGSSDPTGFGPQNDASSTTPIDPTDFQYFQDSAAGEANGSPVAIIQNSSLLVGSQIGDVTITDVPVFSVNSVPAYSSQGALVLATVYDGNTEILLQPETWAAISMTSLVNGAVGLIDSAAVEFAASPAASGAGPVVNIGGEGEVPGAINFQGPWILEADYRSSATGETLAQMQSAGNVFVIGSNSALPFAPGSIGTVITNNSPVGEGVSTWLGPAVQPSQVWQVLSPPGQWISNGVVQAKP